MNHDPQRAVLANVRFSFCNILSPRASISGGEPKYSTTILLPKSDLAGKHKLDQAIEAAIQNGISSKWNGVRPAQPYIPVHDGDGVRPGGEPFGPECKGHWVFTASANLDYKPSVAGPDLEPIMNASDIYSGMYGNVSFRVFPYNSNGRKGVGLGLEAVQKTRDGEPLGATRPEASDVFAGLQQSAQPTTYQAPQQPHAQGQYAPQQTQAQAAPQAAIDPITGQPVGSVMGL